MSRKRAKDKPWITTELKESIKQKHLLYQKFIFDRSEDNWIAYKTFKNKLRSKIRKAEVDYYKNVFNSKTHTGLAFSKLVKPEFLIFRNVVHPSIDDHLNHPMI